MASDQFYLFTALAAFNSAVQAQLRQVASPEGQRPFAWCKTFLLGEHTAQGSGDHALMGLWDTLQQISGEMNAGEITKRTFRCDAATHSPAAGDGSPL